MIVFLIIVAVLAVIISLILSLSATLTVIYDNKWITRVKVLWVEKDIELTKILSFVLFPKESAEMVKEHKKADENNMSAQQAVDAAAEPLAEPVQQPQSMTETPVLDRTENSAAAVNVTAQPEEEAFTAPSQPAEPPKAEAKPKKEKAQNPAKPNYIKSLWDKEGIVGIMGLATNMLETANSAIITFFRGFHIYSFYVKIIIGGGDAADVAQAYGRVCKYYYPFKGAILNGMRVDNYDDLIMPDFIAPRNEYGLQFIGSVNVRLLLKIGLSAGKTFLLNLLKK